MTPLGALAQIGLEEACGEDPSWFCEQVYDRTGSEWWAGAAEWFVAKPVAILVILAVAWVVNRIARLLVKRLILRTLVNRGDRQRFARLRQRTPSVLQTTNQVGLRREARSQTLITVFRSLTTALIAFIALVAVLEVIEIALGPLIAGAGIAGIALGFGAQNLVRDFLTGTFIIIEDQYGVGDFVDLGEAIGQVEKVTLRVTQVRDLNGVLWHVPNGEITRVANNSQEWARAVLDVDVAYDTDLDHAMAVIERTGNQLGAETPWTSDILDATDVWGVQAFGADGITIRTVIKTRPAAQWKVLRELRRRLKLAFDEEGIEIPFPQRTMWVHTSDDPPPGTG